MAVYFEFMEVSNMWLLCIGLSVVLTIVSLVLVSKKRDKAMWASVSSLVLVIVSLLLEYKMILDWVNKNDWSAMLDVVPTMFFLLCIYVVVMILVNVLIIFKSKKQRQL